VNTVEAHTAENQPLVTATTKDVATDDITQALLTAETRGKQILKENIQNRVVQSSILFFSPLKRNKSETFANLYKVETKSALGDIKVVKADKKLMQKLFISSQAGRHINMGSILKHELSTLPLSLVGRNGKMNDSGKSDMLVRVLSVLTQGMTIGKTIPRTRPAAKTCTIIDGHALIQSMGRPKNCDTFNNYGDIFVKSILKHFKGSMTRVDVVFDRYFNLSIKNATRNIRKGNKRPIRTLIQNGDTPFPKGWDNFVSMAENKADLAEFLSKKIIEKSDDISQHFCEVICSGGCDSTISTARGIIEELTSEDEEADTRIALHSIHAQAEGYNVIVECRDTDVLLLLIYHSLPHPEVWMLSAQGKNDKVYPVHQIIQRLHPDVRRNILGFHAITGCDTTSSFSGIGKRSCWKVYEKEPNLLSGVGRNGNQDDVEEYVAKVYNSPSTSGGINAARVAIFQKGIKDTENLPPARDCLELHNARSNHQAKVWIHASSNEPLGCKPEECRGWKLGTNGLEIVWSRLEPIPKACIELISCGCTTKCKSANCRCYKTQQKCTSACGCSGEDCCNPYMMQDSDNDE
jgi:hypothetical protein